jgi:hypothetical protein
VEMIAELLDPHVLRRWFSISEVWANRGHDLRVADSICARSVKGSGF